MIMIESEGITETVKAWRTDVVAKIINALGLEKPMFEAADADVFSWYIKNYGAESKPLCGSQPDRPARMPAFWDLGHQESLEPDPHIQRLSGPAADDFQRHQSNFTRFFRLYLPGAQDRRHQMSRQNITLGRILGIRIGLDYSWFLIFALLTWLLAQGYYPVEFKNWPSLLYWFMGVLTAIMLFRIGAQD
jgi:hypothetical protein